MTKDIFWREKDKFGEYSGMQETSQKKKKVKYMLVKMLIKVTARKTEIKHVTLKLGGGGERELDLKQTEKPNRKHNKYKAQLTVAIIKSKHISNHSMAVLISNVAYNVKLI